MQMIFSYQNKTTTKPFSGMAGKTQKIHWEPKDAKKDATCLRWQPWSWIWSRSVVWRDLAKKKFKLSPPSPRFSSSPSPPEEQIGAETPLLDPGNLQDFT